MKTLSRTVAIVLLASSALALAQSNPGLITGQVPTAAQWNSYFSAKQDVLGFTPLNRAGGTMTGRLVTGPASANLTSGFNLPPGAAPLSPVDGDMWVTSSGLFVRVNGSTIGPIVGSGGTITAGLQNQLAYYNASGTTVAGLATANSGVLVTSAGGVPSISTTLPNIAHGTPTSMTATNLTGTASGLTAGNVTTNANLTGPITSTGNATAIAAQTGTGTTFAMQTSPSFLTDITTPIAKLSGTSNQLVFQSAGVTGTISWAPATSNKTITLPNGTTDFTATGGTSQFLKQASSGAAITVARPACADLSDAVATCSNYVATTWTPTVVGSTSGSFNLSVMIGSYEKIGRQITARFNITATSVNTAVGNVRISLPITSGATVGVCSTAFYAANTTGLNGLTGWVLPAGTFADIYKNASAGSSALTVTEAGNSFTIVGHCVYPDV